MGYKNSLDRNAIQNILLNQIRSLHVVRNADRDSKRTYMLPPKLDSGDLSLTNIMKKLVETGATR